MTQEERLKEAIDALIRLSEDNSIPKNAKSKVQDALNCLSGDEEISLKVAKAINELDEIGSNVNVDSYTRTQIWSIVSLLEKV